MKQKWQEAGDGYVRTDYTSIWGCVWDFPEQKVKKNETKTYKIHRLDIQNRDSESSTNSGDENK